MARITGINSGLDVDALVKASMTAYQSKIDKEAQNKKVLEYQQEQYKKIISDAANFYDKYFDILKTGNLMSTNTYQSVSFKSGDDTKVTAKGFAGASVSNYKVTTTQLASKATASFESGELSKGSKLEIKVDGKEVPVDIVKSDGKIDMAATVKSINSELNIAGIDISAKYSEFSDSIILESGKMGENISFEAGVDKKYTPHVGNNAKGVIIKGTEIYNFDQASNVITVDNVQFSLKGVSQLTKEQEATVSALVDANVQSLTATTTTTTTTTEILTKTVEGITTKTTIITSPDGKTVVTTTDGTRTTKTAGGVTITTTKTVDGATITTTTNKSGKGETITEITKDGKTTQVSDEKKLEHLKELEKNEKDGITYTITKNETKTITDGTKTTQILTTLVGGNKTDEKKITTDGTKTTITTMDGTKTTTDSETGAVSVIKDHKNYTLTSLSGSIDVTALKDKIVNFVNNYNTLLSSINTKIYETRDKDYMPLSDEQKKEMTDDQIEKWETKAQTGLIRKDMDLERITSAMKSAMSTVISGSGLTLESIGIKPVANYAEKNGMFTIDEAKLTKALEENAGNVKDLFTRASSENDKNGGIFTQLAATLRSEFKLSTSSLSKKAGIDGTSTQYSNRLTESIAKKKTLIKELNDKFSVKETALYKKYSALETALEKLNSQQASLSSMLGTS